jgi:MoaA/NifB/PqqE/SkfB family radical SAM enzyme
MTMRIEDLKNAGYINILKYSARDVPHVTIETNRTCNIRCRSCYNLDRDGVKPLAAVKEEIDLAELINPLNGNSGRRDVNWNWNRVVYGELGETEAS